MELLIVPAIIAKTKSELDAMLMRVLNKVSRVMLDVMDGEFVPNTSLNFDLDLPAGLEYEAHLMVRRPLEWVGRYADQIDLVALHIETVDDPEAAIGFVEGLGLRTILALHPETGVEAVLPYLGEVEGVLVMTVNPGDYGGRFLPETLEKVRRLREIDAVIAIEVDGGMNPANARLARRAGANIFASGSFIFRAEDAAGAIRELEAAVSS